MQNRWNYFLISERLKNGGKEQYRKRKSKLRVALNIIGYILGIAILAYMVYIGGIIALLVGGAFFGTIAAFLASMHTGKDILLVQCEIVKGQLNNNLPVEFNVRKVKLGFILSFAPIYIIMLICSLIPGGYLWLIPYLPFFVIALLLSHMSQGFVEVFNFNKHKYNACHVGAHLFILIVGSLIRILVITPAMPQ